MGSGVAGAAGERAIGGVHGGSQFRTVGVRGGVQGIQGLVRLALPLAGLALNLINDN
ncbi:hypothetical protein [Candidatus Chloroploca asiatica]|uniref:hypothetical protein n=1 Tax=Candidatus Chloroploca asiatica TaxID=1506545 RepID=UPI001558908B|nr:hypothetical protein [Candidatus Chloroploca asiatica]